MHSVKKINGESELYTCALLWHFFSSFYCDMNRPASFCLCKSRFYSFEHTVFFFFRSLSEHRRLFILRTWPRRKWIDEVDYFLNVHRAAFSTQRKFTHIKQTRSSIFTHMRFSRRKHVYCNNKWAISHLKNPIGQIETREIDRESESCN